MALHHSHSEAVWHCTNRADVRLPHAHTLAVRLGRGATSGGGARPADAPRDAATAPLFSDDAAAFDLDDVGAANLDWPRLGFDFQRPNGFVKHTWVNGGWDEGEWEPEPFLKLHVMSAAIHYGQGVYEGAKAHHCADGSVRCGTSRRTPIGCWRVGERDDDARRAARDVRAGLRVVRGREPGLHLWYGRALYLRPYIFGHGPQLGLSAAPQFHFCVLAMPVSSYSPRAASSRLMYWWRTTRIGPPRRAWATSRPRTWCRDDIRVSIDAEKRRGATTVLYFEPQRKKIYPKKNSACRTSLVSRITRDPGLADHSWECDPNDMLMDLAASDAFGMKVERRPVDVAELGDFREVAGCGTAVVMMGVKSITNQNTVHRCESIERVEALYNLPGHPVRRGGGSFWLGHRLSAFIGCRRRVNENDAERSICSTPSRLRKRSRINMNKLRQDRARWRGPVLLSEAQRPSALELG